ncbi:MAG TPA: penicillin-binding protein activator, partial [Thermodesulfobacteriota bacterium]|nr:penicillin-binding protein activator [Thermodesulfobacteriota bacterium]
AAARAVESLVAEERVIAVVGPLLPQPAEEAARAAQRLGVPLLALSQRGRPTAAGPFVFRPATTTALQGRAIARQAIERLGVTRYAVLYPDDPYGADLLQAFAAEVRALGATLTDTVAYQPGQTDFGKEIRQLAKIRQAPRTRRTRPGEAPVVEMRIEFDALFIPDYYDRVGLIAPQLAYYDVKGIRLLGAAGWNSPELIRLAREHVEGALFVDSFWAGSPTPAIRDFVARFRARFGELPTVLEAEAYDALRILLDTLQRARPLSRDALREALSRVRDFPGLTGPFAFTADREADRPLLLLTIEDRRIKQVN